VPGRAVRLGPAETRDARGPRAGVAGRGYGRDKKYAAGRRGPEERPRTMKAEGPARCARPPTAQCTLLPLPPRSSGSPHAPQTGAANGDSRAGVRQAAQSRAADQTSRELRARPSLPAARTSARLAPRAGEKGRSNVGQTPLRSRATSRSTRRSAARLARRRGTGPPRGSGRRAVTSARWWGGSGAPRGGRPRHHRSPRGPAARGVRWVAGWVFWGVGMRVRELV
jgi:hypothetical protein